MDSPPTTVTVELDLRIGSEPIAGELRPATGPARPFVGWMALVRTLEDAMNPVDSEESQ
ncbi:MAG: hypothetical protein JST53_14130 [Actinobacteria bacterium]|nr:hypothetical protein [Actinomycetota bacterium]